MSDRLNELRRQRALVAEHLAWLDREIAAAPAEHPEQAKRAEWPAFPAPAPSPFASAPAPTPAPPLRLVTPALRATSPAPSVSDPVIADPDALLEEFRVAPDELKTDVKKGCFLYFFGAMALVALGVVALYFFFNRGRL